MMRRRLSFTLAIAAVIAARLPASAASAIQTITAKVPAPVAGTTETLQIGLTPVDGATWDAKSYTVAIVATDGSGKQIAASDPAPGETPVVAGQTTFVFADLALPPDASGALSLTVTVVHGSATYVSDPISIGVSSAGGARCPRGPPSSRRSPENSRATRPSSRRWVRTRR